VARHSLAFARRTRHAGDPIGMAAIRQLSFFDGVKAPARGLGFILTHPGLWPLCAAPLLINIVVLVGLWWWLGGVADSWLQGRMEGGEWYRALARGALWAILLVARLVVTLVAFVIVGNLAAAPFSDFLSERVDRMVTGWSGEERFGAAMVWRLLIRTPLLELRRVAAYGGIVAALFVLSFMPLLAPVTMLCQLGAAAWFVALDNYSYPLERRGSWHLRQKLAFTREHTAPSLGFGAAMAALGLVPVVNFVFIPLGVVGGMLLYADLVRAASPAPPAPPLPPGAPRA
jgi:CysZ protein